MCASTREVSGCWRVADFKKMTEMRSKDHGKRRGGGSFLAQNSEWRQLLEKNQMIKIIKRVEIILILNKITVLSSACSFRLLSFCLFFV